MQQNLNVLQQKDHFKQQCLLTRVRRKFNPPAAPHFDGSWERLNKPFKDFKDAFYKVIENKILSDETLSRFKCEVEAVLNSRSLTTASSYPTDTEVVTPNHILLGRPTTFSPWFVFTTHPHSKEN